MFSGLDFAIYYPHRVMRINELRASSQDEIRRNRQDSIRVDNDATQPLILRGLILSIIINFAYRVFK